MIYLKKYDYNLLDKIIFLEGNKEPVNWNNYFSNSNPLIVEIGCGNGHFLTEKAKNDIKKNYIGIDIKEKRIIRCKEKQVKYAISNMEWFCGEALKILSGLFENNSISTIFMPFPDPWPKRKHHKHRLFKKEFVDVLNEKLMPSGLFIFITDYKQYFEESYQLISEDNRFSLIKATDENNFELGNSLFGEKWKRENREFYSFYVRKKGEL